MSKVKVPVYLLASREDHIVPWTTAYGSKNLIGSDACFVLAACGHVAGVINPPARNKRSHCLNDKLAPDPQTWFDHAQKLVAGLGCLDATTFRWDRSGAENARQRAI